MIRKDNLKNDSIKNADQIKEQTRIGLYRLNHSKPMLFNKGVLEREMKREHVLPEHTSAYKAFVSDNLKDVSAGAKQMRIATRNMRNKLNHMKMGRHLLDYHRKYRQYNHFLSIHKMLKHKFAMVYTNHVARTNPNLKMTDRRLDHITKPRIEANFVSNETSYNLGANSKFGQNNYDLGDKSDKAFANEEKDMTQNYHIVSGNKLRRKFGKDPFKDGTKIKRSRYYTLSDQQMKNLCNPNHMHKFSGKTLKQHGINYYPYADSSSKAKAIDPKKSYKMPYGDTMNSMRHPDGITMQDFKGSDLQRHGFKQTTSGEKIDPNKTYREPKYRTINQMKSYDFHKAHPRLAQKIDESEQHPLSDILKEHTHHLMNSAKRTGIRATNYLKQKSSSFRKNYRIGQRHGARKNHRMVAQKQYHSMKNGTSVTRNHALNKLGMNNGFSHKGRMSSHSRNQKKMHIAHSRGMHR